jgi:hypothetical protein
MQGRTYEVFVDGKPIGLVGSTVTTLIRRRSGYVKRFGPTVELRLIREILCPDGYDKLGFTVLLRAKEAFDIIHKNTYVPNGLNKLSPLAQVIWSLVEDEKRVLGGKTGGRKTRENGTGIFGLTHQQKVQYGKMYGGISGRNNVETGRLYRMTKEERFLGSVAGGQRNKESGQTAAMGRVQGRRNRELGIGIFAPGAHQKAARNQPREVRVMNGIKSMHRKHHVARNIINPKCILCVQLPSGIEELNKVS